MGGLLKDYIQFGLASWPDNARRPPKHCFLIKLDDAVKEDGQKHLDIEYYYAEDGWNEEYGEGFVPPPTPPKPVQSTTDLLSGII